MVIAYLQSGGRQVVRPAHRVATSGGAKGIPTGPDPDVSMEDVERTWFEAGGRLRG
jgi:hypothetical protein